MTIERDTIPRPWPFLSPLGTKPGEAMPQEPSTDGAPSLADGKPGCYVCGRGADMRCIDPEGCRG